MLVFSENESVTICFSFKLQIVLTGYEITNYENPNQSATWARILKQVSHILLVCYSALNPIAYCGELMYNTMVLKSCCKKSVPDGTLFLSERHLKTNHGKEQSFYYDGISFTSFEDTHQHCKQNNA